jgi:hypothetical protein
MSMHTVTEFWILEGEFDMLLDFGLTHSYKISLYDDDCLLLLNSCPGLIIIDTRLLNTLLHAQHCWPWCVNIIGMWSNNRWPNEFWRDFDIILKLSIEPILYLQNRAYKVKIIFTYKHIFRLSYNRCEIF